jgi:hypothetical protein
VAAVLAHQFKVLLLVLVVQVVVAMVELHLLAVLTEQQILVVEVVVLEQLQET